MTVVKRVLNFSHSFAAGCPQNTREANELKSSPAPYSQHMAGKLYRMACSIIHCRMLADRWLDHATITYR